MKKIVLPVLLLMSIAGFGQDRDYFYQIPDTPEEYTAENVAARMVDGLGFRFYWATQGLRSQDLDQKASEEGRSIEQTVDHILGLTNVLAYALRAEPVRNVETEGMSFEEKRDWVLNSLEKSSLLLKQSDAQLSHYRMIFQSQAATSEFDFWYMINGPVADALWHCGQVVMLRRAAGNPFNSNVSVLQGKLRD